MQSASCSCGSGYTFDKCCGATDRKEALVVARCEMDHVTPLVSLTPEMVDAIATIHATPDLFPARIDFSSNRALLVKMSLDTFNRSIFLDPARIVGSCQVDVDFDWLIPRADEIKRRQTPIIFHSAFCGSTLLSQALASLFNSFSLREPDALGNAMFRAWGAAGDGSDQWLRRVLALLSRRFPDNHVPVIKTNDYANAVVLEFLRLNVSAPMLFMYTSLAEFVAACLKANNRLSWIRDRTQMVLDRAPKILPHYPNTPIGEDDYAKMAALYWSYNVSVYLNAHQLSPASVRCLHFSDLLLNPARAITACAEFFELSPRTGIDFETELEKLFGSYSKNVDQPYSPQQRRDDVDRLLAKFESQIAEATEFAAQLLGQDVSDERFPGTLN